MSTVDKSRFGGVGCLIYLSIYRWINNFLYIYNFNEERNDSVLKGGKLELFSSCSMGPTEKTAE